MARLDSEGADGLRQQLADWFDLPRDVVLDVPRITLLGDAQLAIENHRGLKAYTGDRIAVGMPVGTLTIAGQDLVIGSITGEVILLTGRIDSLRFEPE